MRPLEHLGIFPTPSDRRADAAIERDIDDELEHHLALASADLVAQGMDTELARAEAERRFGDRARVHGACRQALMGERIMLRRFHLILTVALAGIVLFLGWSALVGRERAAAALHEAMVQRETVAHLLERTKESAKEPQTIVVAIGDTLVTYSDTHNSLSARARVVRDGTALLPHIGHVSVYGKTRAEVEELLIEQYATYYEAADVHVQVLSPDEVASEAQSQQH